MVWVVGVVSLLLQSASPRVGRTFVPDWHLGDRWEVWLEEERREPGGRLLKRSNRYRYAVKAVVVDAPGLRRYHLQVRPWRKRSWRRAHLVFVRSLPLRFAPGEGRLYLERVEVQTRSQPPRRIVLDFGALSEDPAPVLMFGTPLPVSFPLFEVGVVQGVSSKTYHPRPRKGAPRSPVPVRQVVVANPPPPATRRVIRVEARGLIEYRLESTTNPLSFIHQLWHPDYPWYIYARGPARRSGLAEVWGVENDPLDLVEEAGRLAGQLGGAGERAALWSFERLLSSGLRRRLRRAAEAEGAVTGGRPPETSRALLASFAIRGFTALYDRMLDRRTALIEVGGLSAGGGLVSCQVRCVIEEGRWYIASGAERIAPAHLTRTRPGPSLE